MGNNFRMSQVRYIGLGGVCIFFFLVSQGGISLHPSSNMAALEYWRFGNN